MDELLNTNNTPPPIYYKRILAANMAILAFYTLYAFASDGGALTDAFLIFGHTVICFTVGLAAVFTSHKDIAKGFFLSAGLVLLVGFGSCLGVTSLFGGSGLNLH